MFKSKLEKIVSISLISALSAIFIVKGVLTGKKEMDHSSKVKNEEKSENNSFAGPMPSCVRRCYYKG